MDELKTHRSGWVCPEESCPFVAKEDGTPESEEAIRRHQAQHSRSESILDRLERAPVLKEPL